MSAPGVLSAQGTIIGTGSAINIDIPGFRPRRVVLHSGGDELYWQAGMPDASGYKRLAAGTGSLLSSNGITPRANGFTIGADADVNGAADVIRWYCTD